MDIGAPPSLEESVPQAGSHHLHGLGHGSSHNGHTHLLELPPLSASFPLPFRVLTLVGLAILLWATNLHILHLLGINVPKALDFRDTEDEDGDVFTDIEEKEERGDLKTTYMTIYKLAVIYGVFVGSGWGLFRVVTGGEVEVMEQWRGLVGVVLLGVGAGALVPWRGIGERERRGFRRYVNHAAVRQFNLVSPSYQACLGAEADVQSFKTNPIPIPQFPNLFLRCYPSGYPHIIR
jgi:hypothetical protein